MKSPTRDGATNQFFGMRNLNGNLLCAIDTGTTGTDVELDELVEVCIIPADDRLEMHTKLQIFTCLIRPENVKHRQETKLGELRWKNMMAYGYSPVKAMDMFITWFDGLQLPPGKLITPLSHNWPFDRAMFIKWLGPKTFEERFSPLYRDTQTIGGFLNDVAEQTATAHSTGHPYPFQKLSNMCLKHGITVHRPKTVQQDALNTLQLYQKLTRRS